MRKLFKNKTINQILISVAASLLVTVLIAAGGVLDRIDSWVGDKLYQQPVALDGEIIVIGIDERALEEIGQYNTWDRSIMAMALEKLAADPEKRPAVVAIDTLYSGESDDEADRRLVDAAKELGNVVTASFATFGTKTDFIDGKFIFNDSAVISYDEPFGALKEASTVGHINAMYDSDGILRHAMLYVEPEISTAADVSDFNTLQGNGYKQIYSMPYITATLYAKYHNIEIKRPPVSSQGRFYVAYSAMPGGYNDGYSLADLLNGEITPDEFAGKAVFIGPYTVGFQDAFFTPISRSKQMYGVEYQANVVQQILDGNYKKEVRAFPQAIVLFAICAIAFFFFQKTKIKISTPIAVVIIGPSVGAAYLLYNVKIGETGHVIHPLWVPVGVLILYIASIVIHYVRSAMEKQRVSRTFERYVAPEIVREILKEGTENLSLGGKTCDIAVLFVDVRGFTTMSERLNPEQVVFILNKYLTMASECVEKNKGTLDKFVGDAMMAFWGAPLPQGDAVYNAVKTAMDIVEGAARVSDELKAEIGEELRVGVGVNYGPAVVGNMGAERHMDYTAIGDTVNTAARLEANAPGGKVYISRAVVDALGDRIETVSLGATIKLKGKADGFEVLEVTSLKQ